MRKILGVLASALVVASCGNADDTASTSEAVSAAAPAAETTTTATEAPAVASPAVETASNTASTGDVFFGDIVYGDDNAPVEIIEYGSLTCGHCANFAVNIFPKIEEKYISTGKVKFIFRNFVMNRYDLAASTAARCTTEEGAEKLLKVYFEKQNDWARSQNPIDDLAAIARKAGISRSKFDRCMANREMHEHLVKMTQDGDKKYKITGTPTILVNGEKLSNYGWDSIDKAVTNELD